MSLHLNSLRHDVRLIHQLRSYELRHFLILLDYAGDRRDPTFVPAKKREELRLTLGFGSGDKGRTRLRERLCRFEELELIAINDDNSISITYLIDQQIEEDDDDFPPVRTPAGPIAPSGPERRQPADRRQPGRTYSMDPAAVRQRERRQQLAQAEGVTFRENVTQNVTDLESKRHAVEPQEGAEMSQTDAPNERDIHVTSLTRVSPNASNVSGGLKNSYDSGNVLNVAASENVTNVTGQNVTLSKAIPPPPVRGPIPENQVRVASQADVHTVMKETGDESRWRGRWIRLWKQCHQAGLMRCWDEGVAIYAWRLKVSPASGPGSMRKPSTFLFGTITALMAAAGTPYVPAAQADADAAAMEPVDDAEAAEIRRVMQEAKALWDAERDGVITPLDEILSESAFTPLEDIHAEMEDGQ